MTDKRPNGEGQKHTAYFIAIFALIALGIGMASGPTESQLNLAAMSSSGDSIFLKDVAIIYLSEQNGPATRSGAGRRSFSG